MKWLAVGICVATVFSIVANTNGQTTTTIMMRDACDPDSFNAALGPGHCIAGHHGNTLFSDFLGELQTDQNAGAWRFNPMLNGVIVSITSQRVSEACLRTPALRTKELLGRYLEKHEGP